MKVIRNKFLPFGRRFYAINLFGVIFAKGPCDKTILNHERIHTAQMRELAYIGFYLLYALEWLVRVVQYGSFAKGYSNLSFEREAYAYQSDAHYLQHRKHYAFVCHLNRATPDASC